ncbi:MAG: hypothetical protein JKY46_10445 [Robiginitomaculum sp.]|nr:hypothetical protein [Robiginitomaculum sp.]
MRGLIITFLLALALVIATYVLMVGALKPDESNKTNTVNTPAASETPTIITTKTNNENALSRQAMENVIDCYGGKPVFLDPQNSRPLYPDCEQLLRIYQGQTTDPEQVLKLLSNTSTNK